jgi:archaellum component FlaF (FlaF/FlaG flagellin family)
MAHLMVYTSNVIIYGSYVNIDICDNKFLKTRGTIGNRTVTSTSRRYDSSAHPYYVDYETTVIEHGILTEDISTTKALVSGRTILLGYHTLEKSDDSYEHYRNLHCKGKICNNQMGPQPGDGKIVISDEIGSRAMGAIQDGELYDSSSDISVHNIESGGWKDVEIECSGNYINEDLHSWNELSDGYRVDIDTKQFYK